MRCFKIEGAKNSFVLVSFIDTKETPNFDHLKTFKASLLPKINLNFEGLQQDTALLSSKAREICSAVEPITDGCIFIFPHLEMDFAWLFYNSDGSEALMCGNAARAVALWFHNFVEPKSKIRFYTSAQSVVAEILNSTTNSGMSEGSSIAEGQVQVWLRKTQFIATDGTYRIYNSGVPHLCVFLNDESVSGKSFIEIGHDNLALAQSLRFPKALDPKGANVTFVWRDKKISLNASKIKAMSFERGVENWTLACGTGAMAAAYFVNETLDLAFPIHVQMPGGVLEIKQDQDKTVLLGPAKILALLELDIL